jgi:hypothetical protein
VPLSALYNVCQNSCCTAVELEPRDKGGLIEYRLNSPQIEDQEQGDYDRSNLGQKDCDAQGQAALGNLDEYLNRGVHENPGNELRSDLHSPALKASSTSDTDH